MVIGTNNVFEVGCCILAVLPGDQQPSAVRGAGACSDSGVEACLVKSKQDVLYFPLTLICRFAGHESWR